MRRPLVPEESFGGKDTERGSREPPARKTKRELPDVPFDPAVERLRRTQRTYGNRASQRLIMQARPVQRESPEYEVMDEELAPAGSGLPLDETAQSALETHFGVDLAHVRVHTDSQAARGAEAIDAQAYTAGRDIYFSPGMYSPSTSSGRRLLAHEVAHVVQQSSGKEPGVAAKRRGSPGGVVIQRQPKTASKIAGDELEQGPKQQRGDTAAWEQAEKRAQEEAKSGGTSPIIQVSLTKNHAPVKEVSSAGFEKEFNACPNAHQENGLPEAFLCTQSGVSPWTTQMDENAQVDTNIRVQTKAGTRGGGEVWVSSANLEWSLKTAGFLDTGKIDASLLGAYRDHELGHREIEDQIATRLAKLAEADLRRSLPQDKTTLKESGSDWVQKGIDAIDKKIGEVKDRYLRWAEELASRAGAAWDSQEAGTLSKIAQSRQRRREPGAPSAP